MYLYFYRNRGVVPLLVRLATWDWRGGQKFRDVPSHVGISSDDGFYFEAIISGVRVQVGAPAATWKAHVPVECEAAALAFLFSQVGKRYDFSALLFDILGYGLPRWAKLLDCRDDRWDCSRLALAALHAGGFKLPDFHVPESPNDLAQSVVIVL